jgi:DnaJ homolog subfamily C member 28
MLVSARKNAMPELNNRSLIDQILQDAMRKGEFDNLPGAGKPLVLEDESNIPEDMRLARRIMKDNDIVPDWVEQRKEIEASRERALSALRKAAQLRTNAQAVGWERAQATFGEEVARINRSILSYNLKVPRGITHMPAMDAAREITRAQNG